MGVKFPSAEWVDAYKNAINSSKKYKSAGAKWTKGAVSLIIKAKPEYGLPEDIGVWLDLEKGVCKDARVVSPKEAMEAPFCITGEYERWKQVAQGKLDPVKGMSQKKLILKGHLPTIIRFVRAAKELVNCSMNVDTIFPDEV